MSQKRAGSSKSYDSLIHPGDTPSNQGAAAFAGILPFVRYLRYQLKLPMYLVGMTTKEKGYRAVSLMLILICRPTTELRFNQPIARPVGAEVYSARLRVKLRSTAWGQCRYSLRSVRNIEARTD